MIPYQGLSLPDDIPTDGLGSNLVERDDGVASLQLASLQQVFAGLLCVHHNVEQLQDEGEKNNNKLITKTLFIKFIYRSLIYYSKYIINLLTLSLTDKTH